MRLNILFLTTFLLCLLTYSQDYSSQWVGHFSYATINGIANTSNGVSVAAENAIYNFNTNSQTFQTTSSINGMSGNTISTYHYSINYELAIVGYENGLLEIINSQNQVTTVVDIVDEANVPQVLKKINHLFEYNNLVYISTDYGISVYDLESLEFKETYFIGSGGAQNPIAVTQVTILNDYIYAATASNGIKRALHANPNIIDFSLWTTITNASLSNWKSIVTHNNLIYGLTTNNVLYSYNQTNFTNHFTTSEPIIEHKVIDDVMTLTANNTVWVYDTNLNLTHTIPFLPEYESNFTHASIKDGLVYIGTLTNGVLVIDLSNLALINNIKPNGPLQNNVFAVRSANNDVWTVYGEHTQFFNPYPLNYRGVSHFTNNNWFNIKSTEVLGAASLVDIAINPFNKNQVFVSSYYSGLLEINDNVATTLHDESSGLASLSEVFGGSFVDIRVGRSAFDRNGKLWMTNNLTNNPLKVLDAANNSWQAYNLSPVVSSSTPQNDELGFTDLVIDQNNTKWIGGYRKGVIGFNENFGTKNIDLSTGNLPSNAIRGLAIDKDNNLWIGTQQGLRVLYNTSNFFNIANPQAQAIIFLDEDGIAKELMFGQYITDIEVDGSNNKWIATFDSGAFYVSPDGQETICHFTKDNSPLPTNNITDISIDTSSGLVYFGTPNGLVAFKGLSKEPSKNLESIKIYPNPIRPEMVKRILGYPADGKGEKGIKIEGLTENVNIKITDISGNLVSDANTNTKSGNLFVSEGGFAIWNGKNFNNSIVATGVYFVMITDLESQETTIQKIMIIK